MTVLDAKTAANLRRQAEALAESQGISLKEARKVMWDAHLAALKAAEAAPPMPRAAELRNEREAAASAKQVKSSLAASWNDSGAPRKAGKPTPEQLAHGKAQLAQVRAQINKPTLKKE